MPRSEHSPLHDRIELSDDRARAVDEAGRRAGAALRSPAPADGLAAVQGRVRRRRVVRVAATVGVSGLLVVGVIAMTTGDGRNGLRQVDTPPVSDPDAPDPDPPASTVPTSAIERTTTSPSVPVASVDFVETGALSGLPWPRFSADSSLLAVESSDETVVFHEAATLARLRELPCPTSLEPLPGSAGTDPGQDRVWDVAAAARWDVEGFTVLTSVSVPRMCGVTMSADGTRAVTDADVQGGSRDARSLSERSLLWDTSDGSLVAVVPGRLSGFGPGGATLVMSNGPSFSIVDGATGAVLRTVTDDAVGTVTSPDGSRLLRWGSGTDPDGAGEATIYDTRTSTPIATLSPDPGDEVVHIEDPVFDDTNDRLVALDPAGLAIWDASTGAQLRHVPIELVDGRSAAISPGGAMIAVRNGSHITVFDSSNGVQLVDLDLGADRAEEVVFSADGVSLAAGVTAGVRVWSSRPTPAVAPTTADEQVSSTTTVTTAARPDLEREEIRVTSDLIEYGDDLIVPVDRVASDRGRLYVLAGQVDEEPRPFYPNTQTAVLVAFDDAGVERWRIRLDGKPTDVVVVDGDPWVLQLDDNSVSRISADDGRILGQVRLDAPVRDAVLFGAYGTVWASVMRASRVDLVDLVRIAPDLSTTTIELPADPKIAGGNDAARGERIASGDGAVWVPLLDAGVAIVDADTDEVTVIPGEAVGHEVRDVAVDGDVVYVASYGEVTSIVDRQVVGTVSFPATGVPGPISYLGPLDGSFGVLLDDGEFHTLRPDDPMVVEHRRLSGQDGSCIGVICAHSYGWDEIDGDAWVESLASPHWALERLRLLPASDDGS